MMPSEWLEASGDSIKREAKQSEAEVFLATESIWLDYLAKIEEHHKELSKAGEFSGPLGRIRAGILYKLSGRTHPNGRIETKI